jgi:hypothetical protein
MGALCAPAVLNARRNNEADRDYHERDRKTDDQPPRHPCPLPCLATATLLLTSLSGRVNTSFSSCCIRRERSSGPLGTGRQELFAAV